MAVDNVYTRTFFAHWAVVYTLIMKNKPAKIASDEVFFVIKSVISRKHAQAYSKVDSKNGRVGVGENLSSLCKGRVRK